MDFYLFLNILEKEFLILTGVSFPGFIGLLCGSALFSLLLMFLRYEKKIILDTNTDNFHNLKNINTSIKSHIHQSSKNYIKNEYI